MLRPASNRTVPGSVSVLALVTMLAACSQPASFATVDLSGSYGQSSQTAQTYNAQTGQPQYQSVSLYGPQSFPDAAEYTPTARFAAVDAPGNQVASLGPDTFGILDQPAAAPYSPVASVPVESSPLFGEAQLLSSPQFNSELQSVDRAFIDTGPLDAPAPAPFAGVAPFEPAPELTESVEVIEVGTALPVAPPVLAPAAPLLPRPGVIEEAALPPLAPLASPPSPLGNLPGVADDYATLDVPGSRSTAPVQDDDLLPDVRGGAPYEPWVAPVFGAEPEESAPAPVAPAPVARAVPAPSPAWEQPRIEEAELASPAPRAPVAEAPVAAPPAAGPDAAFTEAARDLLPQQPVRARIPAPSSVPPVAPAPVLRLGSGMTVPPASTAYPRPYELLRPGVWPELPTPGQGLVEAPATTPPVQLVALADAPEASEVVRSEPVTPVERASERVAGTYEIKSGDTLLTIARRVGTTPEELAFENGLLPEAAIYIGQKLLLPNGPARVAYSAQGVPSVLSTAALDVSDIGGPAVPVIDAGEVAAITGESRIQRASIPTRQATKTADTLMAVPVAKPAKAEAKFAWPVHGEVYQLETGPVEIDAEGNAPVSASAAGKVVHVERGPSGVLVVIEHDNGWRSLTVGLDYSEVRPGERVGQGRVIGKASRDHRVRFELRDAGAGLADSLAELRG